MFMVKIRKIFLGFTLGVGLIFAICFAFLIISQTIEGLSNSKSTTILDSLLTAFLIPAFLSAGFILLTSPVHIFLFFKRNNPDYQFAKFEKKSIVLNTVITGLAGFLFFIGFAVGSSMM